VIAQVEDSEEASHLYDEDSDALLDMDFLGHGRSLEGTTFTDPDVNVELGEDWEFFSANVLSVTAREGRDHIWPAA